MKTIKHKTFEVLSSNELRSFSTQELQKAIWIAQGNKTPFDSRTRQYGNNIKEWIHDGLMLHKNRNEYSLTKWGLHYAKLDRSEGVRYLKECKKKNAERLQLKRSRDKLIEDRAINGHLNRQQHINYVTEKDCIDAITYLWYEGFLDQMRSDDRHHTEILLKRVANTLNHKLKLN